MEGGGVQNSKHFCMVLVEIVKRTWTGASNTAQIVGVQRHTIVLCI